MFHRYDTLKESGHSQPRVAMILACSENLMALSWHMPVSKAPFRYAVAVREENVTHQLIREHHTFTLNCLPFSLFETTDMTGRFHAGEADKLKQSGLSYRTSDATGDIMMDDALFVYECRVMDAFERGDHTIFVADVLHIYVNSESDASPALFLGRGRYTTIMETSVAPRRD